MSTAMMVTAVMMRPGETRLLELLRRRQLSARSRILKRCRELTQLCSLLGVATVGGSLSSLVEPVSDLREDLAELARILLLQLRKLIQKKGCR